MLWYSVMQTIQDGFQHEQPDYWLNFGNPWEIERLNIAYTIKFYGHVSVQDEGGRQTFKWNPGESVSQLLYLRIYTYASLSLCSDYCLPISATTQLKLEHICLHILHIICLRAKFELTYIPVCVGDSGCL